MRTIYGFMMLVQLISAAPDEFRNLTDSSGRSIVAKISYVDGDVVNLIRKGSDKTHKLPISAFAPADQIYLRDFMSHHYVPPMKVSATKKIVDQETSGRGSSRLTEKLYEYEVLIDNTDVRDIMNITVEYRMYASAQEVKREDGRNSRSDKKFETAKGSVEIKLLKSKDHITFFTSSGLIGSVGSGRDSINGTTSYGNLTVTYIGFPSYKVRTSNRVSLRGIWIRVFTQGGDKRLIAEEKSGEVPTDEEW